MTASRLPSSTAGDVGAIAARQRRSIAQARYSQSSVDQILAALDSPILAQTWDCSQAVNATDWTNAMVSGRVYLTAFVLREPAVLTGMIHYIATAGVFSGGISKVGLYRYALDDVNYELIRASTNDGTLFTNTGFIQKPFAFGGEAVESGLYFAAQIVTWTSLTTAPKRLALTTIGTTANPLLPAASGRAIRYDGLSDLPATLSRAAGVARRERHLGRRVLA